MTVRDHIRALLEALPGDSVPTPRRWLEELVAEPTPTAPPAQDVEELLSLRAAALATGYSADWIGRLVKSGKLRNHGTAHRPKVRRGDLSVKPAHLMRSGAAA